DLPSNVSQLPRPSRSKLNCLFSANSLARRSATHRAPGFARLRLIRRCLIPRMIGKTVGHGVFEPFVWLSVGRVGPRQATRGQPTASGSGRTHIAAALAAILAR